MIILDYLLQHPNSWTKNIIRREHGCPTWSYPWLVFRPFLIGIDGPTSHVHRSGTFDEALEWAKEHPANPFDMRELFTDSHETEKGTS